MSTTKSILGDEEFQVMTRKNVLLTVALLAGYVLGLSQSLYSHQDGQFLNVAQAKNQKDPLFKELRVFSEVLSLVVSDYYRMPSSEELVDGAIKGLMRTLDPHSSYLDPELHKELQTETRGEFGGLGIEISMRDGELLVVAPMEDTPAERAGIRAGDIIVEVSGKETAKMNLSEVVKLLRGKRGTAVEIKIRRGEEILPLSVVREVIHVRSVKYRNLKQGIGLVRISQFVDSTSEDLAQGLAELRKDSGSDSLRALIIDLRNNPGGLLKQAISVADMFLEHGVIVYTDGRKKAQNHKYFAVPNGTEGDYPIVVLINEGSASASEIVAGALKDHGRGLIVGVTSFGKGSVQTVNPLKNGGALKLTTALYYTKSGKSIQATGVTPDVYVDEEGRREKPAEELKIRERDLPNAISNPGEGEKKPEEKLKDLKLKSKRKPTDFYGSLDKLLENDEQLKVGIELLVKFLDK